MVLGIIAILGTMLVPAYSGYIEKAKTEVCNINCRELENMYEVSLVEKEVTRTEISFNEFIYEHGKKICPKHGEITYVDGKIKCSVHAKDEDEQVPFLD